MRGLLIIGDPGVPIPQSQRDAWSAWARSVGRCDTFECPSLATEGSKCWAHQRRRQHAALKPIGV